jgi:hypothetical protein
MFNRPEEPELVPSSARSSHHLHNAQFSVTAAQACCRRPPGLGLTPRRLNPPPGCLRRPWALQVLSRAASCVPSMLSTTQGEHCRQSI